MAGNIRIGAGVETPAQSRTSVSGGFSLPARPAPMPAPAGYQLVYQMGGPRYMYGETPRYGAYYSDGGTVPGQIYGNMRGSREGADMFGFFPTMFQSSPYATASQMYTPSLGVMPLIGYPSRYPHVIMGGYTDYGAPIANQAMNMMLPLLMMGLYRQMFPMPGAAPAQATGGRGGAGGSGGGSGKSSGGSTPAKEASFVLPDGRNGRYQNLEEALAQPDSRRVYDYQGFDPDYAMRGGSSRPSSSAPAGAGAAAGPVQRGLRLGSALLNPSAALGGELGRLAADNPVAMRSLLLAKPDVGLGVAATGKAMQLMRDYVLGQ